MNNIQKSRLLKHLNHTTSIFTENWIDSYKKKMENDEIYNIFIYFMYGIIETITGDFFPYSYDDLSLKTRLENLSIKEEHHDFMYNYMNQNYDITLNDFETIQYVINIERLGLVENIKFLENKGFNYNYTELFDIITIGVKSYRFIMEKTPNDDTYQEYMILKNRLRTLIDDKWDLMN
jgi:hypothetical protein